MKIISLIVYFILFVISLSLSHYIPFLIYCIFISMNQVSFYIYLHFRSIKLFSSTISRYFISHLLIFAASILSLICSIILSITTSHSYANRHLLIASMRFFGSLSLYWSGLAFKGCYDGLGIKVRLLVSYLESYLSNLDG